MNSVVSHRTKLSLLLEGVLWEPGSLGRCTSIASAKKVILLPPLALGPLLSCRQGEHSGGEDGASRGAVVGLLK